MKKIIILVMSLILMLSLFVVTPSAVSEIDTSKLEGIPYYYTLVGMNSDDPNQQTVLKTDLERNYDMWSFPLVNGLDTVNAYKISNYGTLESDGGGASFTLLDGTYLDFSLYPDSSNLLQLRFSLISNGSVIANFDDYDKNLGAVDGYFYLDPDTGGFGLALIDSTDNVVYHKTIYGNNAYSHIVNSITTMGTVENEYPGIYIPNIVFYEPMEDGLINTLISSVTSFVGGLGTSFLRAFQNIFMNKVSVNGNIEYIGINPLGIFLVVLFGVALGYGVIRWITGLFRRESN